MSEGGAAGEEPVDETLRDVLSPKALAMLDLIRSVEHVGAQWRQSIDEVREEAFSAESDVWSVANGFGFNVGLAIDDAVLSGKYSVEEVEDLISDAMIDASGLGQAVGERLGARFTARLGELFGPTSP